MTNRYIIPVWFSLLTLPFLGAAGGLKLGIVILAVVWLSDFFINRSAERYGQLISNLKDRLKKLISSVDKRVWPGLLTLLLIILPFSLNRYALDVVIITGIYIVLALGLNIIVGLAGLLVLGYAAFYAVGAYTFAILSTHFGISFWAAMAAGGAVSALFGLILGAPTLRLRGDYLAIVTLGFGEIMRIVLNNWDELTGGPNGIMNIGKPELFGYRFSRPEEYYFLILSIVAATAFAVKRLNDSRIGRAWIAIREDEVAAEAMGINTTGMKLLAFALGAGVAGVAGVFYAAKMGFVSPESFTFLESIIILSMVILGGLGSIPGVIIGAVVLTVLPEGLREFQEYRMLILGTAMILMMLYRPQGLLGETARRMELDPHDDRVVEHEDESLYDVKRGERI